VDISPRASVNIDDGTISLGNLEGPLKSDKDTRRKTADSLIKTYGLKDVIFEKPVRARRDHINPFYNLDLD